MHVFALQYDIAWEDKPANFATVDRLLAGAQVLPGSLLVLPEMFATGFSMNAQRIAEPSGGETYAFLASRAARWKSYIIGGLATNEGGRPRNEALVFDPSGEEMARYVKQQPFTLGGERDCYEAGTRHVVVRCGEFEVAPLICYDLRFPELFRPAVRDGAQVIVVIANWPRPRDAHWGALLRARAIENQAYVVGVNRCGTDPRLTYRGQSTILDPHGNVLSEAGDGEQLVSAELDLKALLDYRRKFPALTDMRLAF